MTTITAVSTPANENPYYPHAGPIEQRIPDKPMHCRTTLPNHECPQLPAGCLGCTFAWMTTPPGRPVPAWIRNADLTITLTAIVPPETT